MTVNSQENELKQQEQQRQQQQQSKMNINNSNNNKIIKTKNGDVSVALRWTEAPRVARRASRDPTELKMRSVIIAISVNFATSPANPM